MVVAAVAVAAGTIPTAAAGAGDSTASPTTALPSTRGYVSGWLPWWSAATAYRALGAAGPLVGTASPFAYDVTGTTTFRRHGPALPSATLTRLRARGVAVVPTVTGGWYTPARMARLGTDPALRTAHVRALVRLAGSDRRYTGLDLNYEAMADTTDLRQARATRAGYSALVAQLCPALRAAGRTCTVTVIARTGDRPAVWRRTILPWVYDYAALGRSVDRLRVMAYDDHSRNTGPGPVAGLPWVRAVVAYTLTQVPAGKVELGIPLYGYDWVGYRFRSVTYPQAITLARRYRATIRYDAVQAAPHFTYLAGGERHTVWFDDARAVAARVQVARQHRLAGVAVWAFGQGDPAVWPTLARLR